MIDRQLLTIIAFFVLGFAAAKVLFPDRGAEEELRRLEIQLHLCQEQVAASLIEGTSCDTLGHLRVATGQGDPQWYHCGPEGWRRLNKQQEEAIKNWGKHQLDK